jgi:hypothetical protein
MFYKLSLILLITRYVYSDDKPGQCPTETLPTESLQPNTTTVCVTKCIDDASCPATLKCCNNGCTTQCTVPIAPVGMSVNVVNTNNTINILVTDPCALVLCPYCTRCENGKCVRSILNSFQQGCGLFCPLPPMYAPPNGCRYGGQVMPYSGCPIYNLIC